MQPTEQLKSEHQAVLTILDILDKMSENIRTGQEMDILYLEEVLRILKEFVDNSHHGKEEKILFKALEAKGLPSQGGPIGVMLHEHDNGRGYIQGMREAAQEFKTGNKNALQKFAVNASHYTSLMREHIYKEDNILYPIADMHLSTGEQDDMLVSFEKIEETTIGKGQKDNYLNAIYKLKVL